MGPLENFWDNLSNFFSGRLDRNSLHIGIPDGLSPNVKLIEHPTFGSIITSQYNIVRFYQDGLAICYNAALAMYATQLRGATYTEMAYHDQGTIPDFINNERDPRKKERLLSDYDPNNYLDNRSRLISSFKKLDHRKSGQSHIGKINQENFLKMDRRAKQGDIERENLFESYDIVNRLFIRNSIENNLEVKKCQGNGGMCSDPRLNSDNFLIYVQTFERILSYGPVIASSMVDKFTFPPYNGLVAGHSYLIYGIVKYMHGETMDAMFVCVDPNYPEHDTFIPVFAFANQQFALISAKDRAQMRPNVKPFLIERISYVSSQLS